MRNGELEETVTKRGDSEEEGDRDSEERGRPKNDSEEGKDRRKHSKETEK